MKDVKKEWISKKELLRECGISYGQLYRWKREGLLPTSWFVKRSAFTGQETFLPRERALARIRFILDNKDSCTFARLMQMLNPRPGSRSYSLEALASLPGVARPAGRLAKIAGTELFDHAQALTALVCERALASVEMDDQRLDALIEVLVKWESEQKIFENADGRLVIIKAGDMCLPLYLRPDSTVNAPDGVETVFELKLCDIPDEYTKRLNELVEGED